MKSLLRRLERIEDSRNPSQWLLVPQYTGMDRREALLLRFGPAGPPKGAELIFLVNALTPENIDPFWANEKESPAYDAAWEILYLKDPASIR